jgi:L-rhamnose isomerase
LLRDVRTEMKLDPDPLEAFRKSGYLEKITRERSR